MPCLTLERRIIQIHDMGSGHSSIVKKFIFAALLLLSVEKIWASDEKAVAPDTSSSLTMQAWDALKRNDYLLARQAASRCQTLYGTEAERMQKTLRALPMGDSAKKQWALNDVGTCTFILGKVAEAEKKPEAAAVAYQQVLTRYGFAQCWDPQGWYWQVAPAAQERLTAMALETP